MVDAIFIGDKGVEGVYFKEVWKECRCPVLSGSDDGPPYPSDVDAKERADLARSVGWSPGHDLPIVYTSKSSSGEPG